VKSESTGSQGYGEISQIVTVDQSPRSNKSILREVSNRSDVQDRHPGTWRIVIVDPKREFLVSRIDVGDAIAKSNISTRQRGRSN